MGQQQQTVRWAEWGALAGIALLYAVMLLRRLGDVSLGYPDADRILMDGVFFRDFFVDLPLTDVYGYVKSYFAQYPALSIGYRPPVFPVVEGLFNLAFGVNMWSSRLALLAFGLVGLLALYGAVRQVYGHSAAIAAAALYATTPFIVRVGWYTMGEVPVVSVALVAVFFYAKYLSTRSSWALWGTALATVTAMWTKQTAIFLVLWILLHQVMRGTLVQELRQRRVWAALLVSLVLLLPLLAITLWLGQQNFAQSIGSLPSLVGEAYAAGFVDGLPDRLQPDRLLLRIRHLYEQHLEVPTLILAGFGLAWALVRRDGRIWFWVSFVVAVYVFFTYIRGANARYAFFWIPAFAVFASLPLSYLSVGRDRAFRLYGVAVLLAVLWHVWIVGQAQPKFATGYDEAAGFVLDNSESPTVFFDGYNNGYFTYFIRALDPDRSMYVLRGDKLLSSTSIAGHNRLEVHVENSDEMLAIFDQFGPQFIVVEDRNTIGIPVHSQLRELLSSDARFRLVKSIPVETGEPSTRPPLKNLSLLVYEDTERVVPSGGVLELRLPVVGQTLRVPFRPGPKRTDVD